MALVVCGVCQRHVKRADSVCPFCGASVPTAFRPVLGGALVLGVGLAMASCGNDANSVPLYGPASFDGSVPIGDGGTASGMGGASGGIPSSGGKGSGAVTTGGTATGGVDVGGAAGNGGVGGAGGRAGAAGTRGGAAGGGA
jgi:hypothetical protein